jgi:hypothetical protein
MTTGVIKGSYVSNRPPQGSGWFRRGNSKACKQAAAHQCYETRPLSAKLYGVLLLKNMINILKNTGSGLSHVTVEILDKPLQCL